MRVCRSKTGCVVALIAGAILIQMLLYGPSLAGRRILAPMDCLVVTGVLGRDPQIQEKDPQNKLLLDPVEIIYPYLEFAASEIRSGRLPLWNPYTYSGSPFLASHPSAIFAPFNLVYYAWPDPRAFVWIHLLKGVVAGLGAFLFLQAVGRSRGAALIGGLCFAHAGYFIAWLSFPLSACAVWLPWAFWTAEMIIDRPEGWGGPGLAAVAAVLFYSGHLETAAQILLGVAFYGAWRWIELLRVEGWTRRVRHSLIAGIAAGLVGIGLGAVQWLPTSEYLTSSLRIIQRKAGWSAADPPCNRAAELLRIAFPYLLGTWQRDSHIILAPSFNESSVNGYVGFTFLGLLAPLGIASRWRHSSTWCWIVLALVAAAPMFRIPILDLWAHIPPFDLMRNNRMLLITGWAILVLGVQGIDALALRDRVLVGVAASGAFLALGCAIVLGYLGTNPTESLLSLVTQQSWPWFRGHFLQYAAITCLGSGLLVVWLMHRNSGVFVRVCLGLLALIELVVAERGYNPQVDPATYYPPREFIRYVSERVGDGRVCGLRGIFTPNISMMYRLRDVRGYDSVDPLPYLELLRVANLQWTPQATYAVTRTFWSPPSPILDLLSVRYIISARPLETTWESVFHGNDLWIYHNANALPRVYVPREAIVVPRAEERVRLLADPSFDPRNTVLISEAIQVSSAPANGTATLVEEEPCRVRVRAHAETDSIIVLADSWSPGWTVTVDGKSAQPLQANHALRAVQVPAGEHMIEWTYFPASIRLSFWITGGTVAVLGVWCSMQFLRWRGRWQAPRSTSNHGPSERTSVHDR